MNRFFILVAVCIYSLSFSQVSYSNAKSIEAWINQNFSNSRTAFNNGKYMFVAYSTVSNGVLNQKNTTKYFEPRLAMLNQQQQMTLNLKNLYYDSVTYAERGGQYYIYGKCINNTNCSSSINDKGERNGSETPLLGMIATDIVDINKCLEAFGKLIQYYGGKKQYNW